MTHNLNDDLCLEKVNVLREVQRVLATVADHVCIENIVSTLEHSREMHLVYGALQRALQQPHEKVDHLWVGKSAKIKLQLLI